MFKALAILPENGFLAGIKCILLVIYSPKCSKTCTLSTNIGFLRPEPIFFGSRLNGTG
jgi:hypothetical protein